jgi:hypothetical protein
MDADLDLLLTAVYVTADDLLLERGRTPGEASQTRRSPRSALRRRSWEYPRTGASLRSLTSTCATCSPKIPAQAGCFKRRRRLAETLEWLIGVFASQSPGSQSQTLLVDSTPVERARSRETLGARRSATPATPATTATASRASAHLRALSPLREALSRERVPDGHLRARDLGCLTCDALCEPVEA